MIRNSSDLLIKNLAESISLEFPQIIFPLEEIIIEEDIKLFYDSYGDTFDGMTIYDDSEFYMHINTFRGNHQDTPRARFTIAHELGHYFIDNHRIGLMRGLLKPHPSRNNENSHAKIEREADYFASCLLMPEEKFKKFFHRKKFDFEIIKNLAEQFQTSITATAIRFASTGNHAIMIVFGENGQIKWRWNSEDFIYKYLLYSNKIPENSVMGDYFNNMRIPNGTEEVWAIDWFNYVNPKDSNLKFKEHCLVHKNKALSIIW